MGRSCAAPQAGRRIQLDESQSSQSKESRSRG
jgi:hypothetical protein